MKEKEKFEPKKEGAPTPNRYEMQSLLIKEFYKIKFYETKEIEDQDKRNAYASEWIGKYADNFNQLDEELIEK